eukprot:CAMPEP_0117693634 /NCGR_PEP_ID=MMETSP0804-20121206/26992_1 /TAXON_ID=1074897 /ORGANISM="Tetraselmis astigmatica, Strain CCMP880" /LENGTH=102 /DNA_ID=CAMNT_0005507215 /DNA_START=108 /DNA_END=413 /DNA_ORIENTATION=+
MAAVIALCDWRHGPDPASDAAGRTGAHLVLCLLDSIPYVHAAAFQEGGHHVCDCFFGPPALTMFFDNYCSTVISVLSAMSLRAVRNASKSIVLCFRDLTFVK